MPLVGTVRDVTGYHSRIIGATACYSITRKHLLRDGKYLVDAVGAYSLMDAASYLNELSLLTGLHS